MIAKDVREFGAALRHWLRHAEEHQTLFPVVVLLGLALIWGPTLYLFRFERAVAERTAAVSSHTLSETYEAQVIRALREIDQTLKFVKYAYEFRSAGLEELTARALLPPELLFVVTTVDNNGDVVASTRPLAASNIADQDYFQSQLKADAFAVSRPEKHLGTGEWTLRFTRRLDAADGGFAGVVMVSVDAAYFVSAYEPASMGAHGFLGIIGSDGVFRARRTGDAVTAGDFVDYASVVATTDAAAETPGEGTIQTNPWDGVRRYTSAHELYDLPLTVVVGLSVDEQLAASGDRSRTYWRGALALSVLMVLLVWAYGRMRRQVVQSRKREDDERLAHAKQAEFLAYHDGLTGLPNRSMFGRLLGQSVNEARRYDRQVAVLFLDLDRFKNVNDTLGHEAGDQLLQEVASRIKLCLRESDTVARLGGDEFVALLPDLSEEKYVATVAEKILSAVARPFVLLGQEFRITASVGISIYPQDGLDEQTLTKNADIAMYQAKEVGKNNYQFYSDALNASSLERLTLESGLRNALERSEFKLHYQAKQDIRTGQITGMEALLRWQHPDLGTIAPRKFLPVAEETGLIVPIGKWVLRAACKQNVAWQNLGTPGLSIAVNMTSRQFFHHDLLKDLQSILADTGLAAHLLELEVSESLLMHDVEKALRILEGLKEMGIRIAIDDFGVGYASLSTLRRFPLDTIKIDRSFIRDVASVGAGDDVAGAIIAMGRTLSLTVVAQGVETKEQADFLRRYAPDQCQGFYFAKPVPADQITRLLRSAADSAMAVSRPLG